MAASPSATLSVVEEDSSKRRQILDGARKLFLDLGFDGASMGEIARAAGVSKGTLYVYFADKNRLFEAIVEQESLEQGKVAFNFDPARDVPTTLMDFGQAYIQLLCRPGGGSATRTVMAIAERMPEVGKRFYENVVALKIRRLADYLDAHVAAGDLAIEDCELAAAQFMQMCQATLFQPFIFQAAPAPSAQRIAQVVESATRMFLAAYQVKPA
jgi:AcrR family transcriptional regulator